MDLGVRVCCVPAVCNARCFPLSCVTGHLTAGTLSPPEMRRPRLGCSLTPETVLFPAWPCRVGRRASRDLPHLKPHQGHERGQQGPSTTGLLGGEVALALESSLLGR